MSWQSLTELLSFTGVKDATIWQDVIFGALLIPFSIEFVRRTLNYFENQQPLKILLSGYLSKKNKIIIYLSQLRALKNDNQLDNNPQYAIEVPNPSPVHKNASIFEGRCRIDPVWSEGDGECLADMYNILGKAGRLGDVEVGNLVKDWEKWNSPIISIGFNPKTNSIIKKCQPVFYSLKAKTFSVGGIEIEGATLEIKGHDTVLDCLTPNDGSIIQKTYIKDSNIPVMILAGIGTTGTSAAGYFLRENSINIGKLYSNKPFCFLLYVNINEGRSSVIAKGVYPKPSLDRIILHPLAYLKFRSKSIFPK